MKKRILLLIVLFMVTGCSTQYNLEINEENFNEEIITILSKSNTTKEMAQAYTQQAIPITQESNQTAVYNTNINEDTTNYYLKYSYQHTFETFPNSYFASTCYQNITLNENDEQIELSTSDEFLCIAMDDGLYNDSVQVNITTDLKVIENNADQINGNTYTWEINKENYTNKPINITLKKNFSVEQAVDNLKPNEASKDMFIIGAIVSILIILVIIIIKLKLKNNNKI